MMVIVDSNSDNENENTKKTHTKDISLMLVNHVISEYSSTLPKTR